MIVIVIARAPYVRNAHVSGRGGRSASPQGFVFFPQKRFAFRRTAVLHITGDGETADADHPDPHVIDERKSGGT
ncbi:hypothetical protein, partial [Streptomyces anandii]|uniref:hypothetical protein n=1 Tax=Streptomyces anandii TaxID=285454 RepID=UPI001E63E8B3